MGETYNPKPEQERILDRAFELVQSVPYQVSARWLFYMLLQEGTYADKDSYKSRFLPLVAKARKAFYKNWRPDTLADDTRRPFERGRGFFTERSWAEAVGEVKCNMDMWHTQPYYCEAWFEAKAMSGQFQHYTEHLTLRPFGGDPSIPYKWTIAKELEKAYRYYRRPIIILYFGDLDPKGLVIPESAARDIQEWCNVPFEFIRAGLNPGDEDRYNIMENPDKPGTYQWEALDDDTARDVITQAVDPYVDREAFAATLAKQNEATERLKLLWPQFMELWDEDEQNQ
jgi:hypothetical protein